MSIEDQIVKKEILESTKEQFGRYQAMSRERLLKEYEDKTGICPHPRTKKEFLVTALSRWFQTRLYCEKMGHVPAKVAMADMRFFLSNKVFLISKDRERAHKKKQKKDIVVQQLKNVKNVPNDVDIQDKHLRPLVDTNPYSKYPLSEFFETLLTKKVMSYDDITKWCDEQEKRVFPVYVFNSVVSDGNAEWMIQDEEGVYFVWSEVDQKDIKGSDGGDDPNDIERLANDLSVDKTLSSRIGQCKSDNVVGDIAPNKKSKKMIGKVIRKDRDLKKIKPDLEDDFEEFEFDNEDIEASIDIA